MLLIAHDRAAAKMVDAGVLWRCVERVCNTHDNVLRLLTSRKPNGAASGLHRVNRALCEAANRSV